MLDAGSVSSLAVIIRLLFLLFYGVNKFAIYPNEVE